MSCHHVWTVFSHVLHARSLNRQSKQWFCVFSLFILQATVPDTVIVNTT